MYNTQGRCRLHITSYIKSRNYVKKKKPTNKNKNVLVNINIYTENKRPA